MSNQYGGLVYGDPVYGLGDAQLGDSPVGDPEVMADYFVDCLPPYYRPLDARDFLRRFLYYAAQDLAGQNAMYDRIYSLIDPGQAPGDWLDWMLAEWWNWTLIPDGYPIDRKRRLLANLHHHYQRRYTIAGVRELLREFGIIAEVYDRPLYARSFTHSRGSRHPLRVRVYILGYEPFYFPKRTFVGGFVGGRGTTVHKTREMITERFVMDLVRWCRVAGVEFLVEWKAGRQALHHDAPINDDDEIVIPEG